MNCNKKHQVINGHIIDISGKKTTKDISGNYKILNFFYLFFKKGTYLFNRITFGFYKVAL